MSEERGVHAHREIMGQSAAWEATLNEVLNQEQSLQRFLQEEGFKEGGEAAYRDIQGVEGLSCRSCKTKSASSHRY